MTLPIPKTDRASQVFPGIWKLSTCLPGHPLGWVNSYLLASEEGAVLIDTAWSMPEVQAEFLTAIAETSTALSDIRTVVLTHYHDDHSGSAAYLRRQGATVAIHPADLAAMQERFDNPDYGERLSGWLGRTGADVELTAYAVAQQSRFSERFELPEVDIDLEDGQLIELGPWKLLVVHTPGHTPGSVCFFELGSGILFSGDHVFPRRRSNAVHRPIGSERPLADYWKGMRRLLDLDPNHVMPGHEYPFDQFADRIAHLSAIRDRKSEEILALLAEVGGNATAYDLAPRMRRRATWGELDGNARLAAVGETLAYLVELEHNHQIESIGVQPQRWRTRKETFTA